MIESKLCYALPTQIPHIPHVWQDCLEEYPTIKTYYCDGWEIIRNRMIKSLREGRYKY